MTTVINIRPHRRAELLSSPDFLYVGRRAGGWNHSIWGNPYKLLPAETPGATVARFRAGLRRAIIDYRMDTRRPEGFHAKALWEMARALCQNPGVFDGKALGCWCLDWDGTGDPPRTCHAVELILIAREIPSLDRVLR